MFRILFIFCLLTINLISTISARSEVKTNSVLFPKEIRERAIHNAEQYSWAKEIRDRIVERAQPWMKISEDELWDSMFGPNITRTWMVWSDGICPQCHKDVKMYNWIIDIWNQPFKVRCPNCQALFPTNDFAAYNRSGLNEQGVFEPQRADRSLLFNAEYPDPKDPLHTFGVDDGEGYVENGHRWRFIGYYLTAGQWRIKMVAGARILSEAYLATGDPAYARRAAILLDRVADLYPTFEFYTQGLVYETKGHRGYVSTWHDACEEVRELAQAYDRIFDGIVNDPQLIAFLSQKAQTFKLSNPKTTFAQIQSNIEAGIFRHTLEHRDRIESNYPRTPVSILTMEAVMGWPGNREQILQMLSEIVETSVKEDGLTGEKGLSGYTTIFPRALSELLGRFDRLDPSLVDDLFKKYPALHKTFRFHIDTWCLDRYYPHEGDCGSFGSQSLNYCGTDFSHPAQNAEPSMFYFFWRLYELTHDPAFVQVLYKENGNTLDGLPHDLCADQPEQFQQKVKDVIAQAGIDFQLRDVNLEEWGLSILRSGEGENRRAVWLDHDSGGRHSHHDGLNLGLFAYGLDLLPDFGYPPVGYGGWGAPKAVWYTRSAAHNTIVVNGKEQNAAKGKTTLWGAGKKIDMVRVSAPALIQGEKFERTVIKVDLTDRDFYLLDSFRIRGGTEHAFFLGSNFGAATPQGLKLKVPMEYGYNTETRNFLGDPNPKPGWCVDWKMDDRFHAAPSDTEIHLRYTGLTDSAEAALGECWIDASNSFGGSEEWIPRLLIRRKSTQPPLDSHFIGVLEPYNKQSQIKTIQRISSGSPESSEAVVVDLVDGRRQIFLFSSPAVNAQSPTQFFIKGTAIIMNAEAGFISLRDDIMEYLALGNGKAVQVDKWECRLKQPVPFLEVQVNEDRMQIITGDENWLESSPGNK